MSTEPSLDPSDALARCRRAFVGVGLLSAMLNLLALTGSIYMLQVYDRVIPARSIPTLVGLTVMMAVLYAAQSVFDILRARVLVRIGGRIDRLLRGHVLAAVLELPLRLRPLRDGLQPIRDLDQMRGFLSGVGPTALFDLPWMPLYLILVYLLHPLLGLLATAGAAMLVALTVLTDVQTRAPSKRAAASAASRHAFADLAQRNAEAVRALGMAERVAARWLWLSTRHAADQRQAADVASTYSGLSKGVRMALQSAVLGLGAYLVIQNQATAGVMIAASITVSRALAPVEIAVANWRHFLAARNAFDRLGLVLKSLPPPGLALRLPPPFKSLSVEALCVAAPGQAKPIVQNVTFALRAGAGLAIVGPSASGKSTLARALVNAWLPQRGAIRLDGAALDQWAHAAVGKHIGYLPQDIELFEGTVAENIARGDSHGAEADILLAAADAGVHEMILRLPRGYDTEIGLGGCALSAGQRQRIALARALYGRPFLVVLDEPNANLDTQGDTALTCAIEAVRRREGIVIVIAHRPSALAGLDLMLVMAEGQAMEFGPKDEIMRRFVRPAARQDHAAPHVRLVEEDA